MNAIERVKHDGAARALCERIESLRLELANRNWDGLSIDGHYCRLGEAMNDAENIIKSMRETLRALQEMEPDNR
ncbi:MAG: hypothetical protein KJN72_12275 [Woeseia sp.]|nr:hypothetical protein [Woeseia sp.]